VNGPAFLGAPEAPFTFADLAERTAALSGPDRMAVFAALPESLQREAWQHLRELMDYRADRDLEETR
jgi:hypothetical protein